MMSAAAPPPLPAAASEAGVAAGMEVKPAGMLRRWVCAVWKLFVGMICCQSFLLGIAAVGWTYRLMRRFAYKEWWKRSPRRHPAISFRLFAAGEGGLAGEADWPNWILAQRAVRRADMPGFLGRWFGSLWANLKTGAQGVFNTWVFTLPACVLWIFSWYAGWDNSFNKGYEQAWVGPVTGMMGVGLFIAAMFYVPMAQARQAVTGEFKAFYHYRRVRQVIRRRWFSSMLLAAAYSLLALPVSILMVAPFLFSMGEPPNPILSAPPGEQLEFLQLYYFWSALVVFPFYVGLRLLAARIYASAVLDLVKRGEWGGEELTATERSTLRLLGLDEKAEAVERSMPTKVALWAGSNGGRITAGVLTAAIWFTFVAQLFVVQFLHYHPGKGWWNHSLVHMPWFHHVPAALKEAARE